MANYATHSIFILLFMIINNLIIFMLYNSVINRRDQTILVTRIGLIIIKYCIIISYFNFDFYLLENSIGLFGGVFSISCTGYFFHVFIFLLSYIIIGLNGFYPRKIQLPETNFGLMYKLAYENKTSITSKMGQQFKIIEYTLMLLFVVTGSLFLISSNDLVSLFLSIELQSYGLYLICTIYRNSEPSTAGGLIYFLLGGLSSCFIVLSTSLLYSNSGTTNLEDIYIITTISETDHPNDNIAYSYKPYYIHMSLIVMGVGLLFKISAAPFHFWSPVVYDGIPTIVTTFVANIAKISIFIFLLELVHYTNKSLLNFNWTVVLLVSSLLSLIIGTVLGLTQSRIKRLYAYSTISHVGFILLALNIQTVDSIQAFIFYLIQYSLSNLNAFVLLLAIGFTFYCYVNDNKEYKQLQDINNSPIQLISQLKGYFYLNPVLTLSLSITLFSFIGIPPLMGFFAKQYVLISALDSGYIFMCLVAILTSVISAVYYLLIIKQLFFEKSENKIIGSGISLEKNQLTSQYNKITRYWKENINMTLKKINDISFIEIIRSSKYNEQIKSLDDNNLIKFLEQNKQIKRSSSNKFIGVLYNNTIIKKFEFDYNNIILSSYLTITISILTLFLVIFMFNNGYILNMISILTLSIFYN